MNRSMKIIIVEDEIRIREGISKLLGKLGEDYEVLGEACDGNDGLKLCLKEKPDLVITDIRMPKMDGIEMLEKIYQSGLKTKAIVVSAYSEFEYARGAMKLGVTEYLLKPISLMDFSNALNNIKVQIQEEQLKKPKNIGTPEQTITDLFYGSIELDDEIAAFLLNTYQINVDDPVFIMYAYLGNAFDHSRGLREEIAKLFPQEEDISYISIDSPLRRAVIYLFYKYRDAQTMERKIQYRMLSKEFSDIVFGCTQAPDLGSVKSAFDNLSQYMDWNISFEKEILISYPKIKQIQTAICSYPMDMERELKVALSTSDKEKAKQIVKKFHASFLNGKVYLPREIKDCYVRFLWFAMEIARDLGYISAHKIERQELLKKIMDANSKAELLELSDEVIDTICTVNQMEEEVTDLIVKKAKSMIHEYYNTGITLDEIAGKLKITPEYLGTKFRNETGVTFSTYMKDYRIAKAKELLLGTDYKLYEIAERIGYNDPKYFSRVFKEATGMLPADYRKSK